MRLHIVTLLLLALIVSSCNDNSSGPPATALDPITPVRIFQFELTGNGYDHKLFNDDSASSFMTSISSYPTRFEFKDVHGESDGLKFRTFSTSLFFKNFASGTTQWSDLWKDSTAFGCIIEIEKSDGTTSIYRSTSGSTAIQFYTTSRPDSLFGVFAGTLKDAFGNTVSLSKGKFYAIFH